MRQTDDLINDAKNERRPRQQLEIVGIVIPKQVTEEKLRSQPLWRLQERCRPRDPD